MINPIRKRRIRVLRGGYMQRRLHWVAICPACEEEVAGNQYYRSSRKTAKDALHRHNLKNHAEPRRDVP